MLNRINIYCKDAITSIYFFKDIFLVSYGSF